MTWTDDLIESLPINGGYDIWTDAVTGHTTRKEWPRRFLVTDDDAFCWTDRRTGQQWRIGRDLDGEYWKEHL